ncbi:DNA cytosine methyltransferase [Acinetobacter bereziniae]|uniref:DNA cytosine methyltransferase n=1 Tax=Acinetobacter bereziniae TaxID=106648 RepID=UPI0011172407|nr:DNA cytosine methyltransferase [Acinetobacter bereziniae]TNL46597.1 DNA cytosine methyltransferase [Acinetobacter bereziniae]TNL56728.1 DNA cytosine methyltransferase [Acinetobacter bereziniae]
MKYGSVCSGIEAATVAWHELGWKPVWFAEIEKFPSQVLAHHYPDIPNLGDMTTIAEKVKSYELEAPDILVGGTPCQAFSVAGLRNSLDDDRGQLSLEFVRLANEIDTARLVRGLEPVIAVWENVPGVLNTKDNAFGCLLAGLAGEGCELQPPGGRWKNAGCVFGPSRQVVWRVLDAQHFGLAQRRKRVFVIASARTECITEILFERKGMFGDIEKSQSERESIANHSGIYTNRTSETVSGQTIVPPLLASHGQKKWLGNQEAFCGDYYIKHAIGVGGTNANSAITVEKAPTLLGRSDRGYVIHSYGIQGNIIGRSLNSGGQGIGFKEEQAPTLTQMDRHGVVIHGTQDPIINTKTAHCLGRNNGQENVLCEQAYSMIADTTPKISKQINGTLRASGGGGIVPSSVVYKYIARYLTEIECERLQGFSDNYTNIPRASATQRYKALGNSMAVTVMRWIGERIQQFIRGGFA